MELRVKYSYHALIGKYTSFDVTDIDRPKYSGSDIFKGFMDNKNYPRTRQ